MQICAATTVAWMTHIARPVPVLVVILANFHLILKTVTQAIAKLTTFLAEPGLMDAMVKKHALTFAKTTAATLVAFALVTHMSMVNATSVVSELAKAAHITILAKKLMVMISRLAKALISSTNTVTLSHTAKPTS